MPDRLAEDDCARERALAMASFIVEAPAGAGKTELLSQRYLRLLAAVEQPEEVLALTFTNKAATEMRDRILGSLERAAAGTLPEAAHQRRTFDLASRVLAHDAARGWHLLSHPGRLRITTLDALCASLVRQMPYLSRFGSQPAVTDDAAAHYAAAARRTLAMVETATPDADVVAAALAFMDNHAGRLETLLVAMLARRDQWLPRLGQLDGAGLRQEVEAVLAALIAGHLAAAREWLDDHWQGRLMPLARFAAAQVPAALGLLADWQTPLAAAAADLPRWRALTSLLLTTGGTLRKNLNVNSGFPPEQPEQKKAMREALADLAALPGLEASLAALDKLPPPGLSDEEWATVGHFVHLLRLAVGQLWLVFQEAGEVDFIEIALRASLALGDEEQPTDLALALDYRIRHLLIDEFQDTSPSQVDLLARLTRGWTAGDGRTLFVVGDPMQSIYRFRKADVGLFLRVREQGIGGIRLEHLRLLRNNRSYPAIVDWVNRVFPSIFPPADEPASGAVRYAPSLATRPAREDSAVLIHALIADDDAAALEARAVLDIIHEARRAAPAESIAVLARARNHLDALVGEIRRHAPDLRFQAVDIEGLDDRQHVQDVLSLFRALHHRADRVHWLALLRAPWCGLTLADLHALAGDDRRRTIWQLMQDGERLACLSPDGEARLRQVRDILSLAFAQRDRQHPRRWLEAVWLLLGGPRCLAAAEDLADISAFFALLDRLAAAGKLDAATLAGETAKLFAPADPEGGAVQMMTVHKAKGLEFDTVIVPGLHRGTPANAASLLLWDEIVTPDGRERLLVAPLKAKGQGGDETAYDYLRRLENQRGGHEAERLLYVAATRAIRHLHLVGVAAADENGGLKPPPAASLLRLLWPEAQPIFAQSLAARATAPAAAPLTDPAAFVSPLLRLQQLATPEELVLSPRPAPLAPLPLAEEGNQTLSSTLEAALGVLIHRALEGIARDGVDAWPTARVAALEPAWRRWLQRQGQSAEAAQQAAAEAVAAIGRTLASATGQWLLASHAEAGAEQDWSSLDTDGVVTHHVIDRCFVADGCRWIIDYKTTHGATAELPARAASHRPQLERYAALFADDSLPLRLAIYFPLQDCLIELD
ncbi:MAG: UvrD-helicase domain-containing protein [Azonexus sp.]|jgi:ATP-dependent exoDNAse (exonuclease V) beta subunit|nr:UvrD-helicase domain-containing protein [Azonexus sp.]